MPLNPLDMCFRSATTQKTPFFAHKKVKNDQKLPIWGPNQCLLGLGRQFEAPPTPFGGCWTENKASCMPLNAVDKCLRAAASRKTPFFAEHDQKVLIFSSNQCFLGPDGQLVPPLPFFEGSVVRKDVLHALEPI